MSTHRRRHLRRTDLFLVRVWTEEAIDQIDGEGAGDPSDNRDGVEQDEWSGSVQRVVDGEARPFKGWQSLADAMRAMLWETRGKSDR